MNYIYNLVFVLIWFVFSYEKDPNVIIILLKIPLIVFYVKIIFTIM